MSLSASLNPRALRITLDRFHRGIAGRREAPLFPPRGKIFKLDELSFEEGVEIFTHHVDLMGGFLQ